jgi:hypothetical protein
MISLPIEFDSIELQISIDKHFDCYDCNDTREVTRFAYDSDSHNYYPDGTKPCICTI